MGNSGEMCSYGIRYLMIYVIASLVPRGQFGGVIVIVMLCYAFQNIGSLYLPFKVEYQTPNRQALNLIQITAYRTKKVEI